MKKIYYSLILLIVLICLSCSQPVEIKTTEIKDSLIYIRGEDSNQQDLISSATGFLIAKEDSWFSQKYFVLTAKHSIKEGINSTKFKSIPFKLAEEHVPDDQDWISRAKIYKGSKNESTLDLIVDLDGVDVSIISFNSNQELPIPFVSYHKPIPQEKLILHGFIRCIVSNSQNKFFSYHSTEGEIADLNYINRVEREEDYKNTLLEKLKNTDKEHEKEKNGIDIRYSNSSRGGMSGSPIVIKSDNREIIVGIQNRKLKSDNEPNTCVLDPQTPYSYGTSMYKILSANNFPENIKKLIKIDKIL
jgi:hypothetical protein